MANSLVQFRTDENARIKAAGICEKLGIDLQTYLRICMSRLIQENGIPFSCVPIELTESAAIYNDRIKETTGKLADAGFQLHIDDFGAGYSSLISLNQFPFSTLKIDKSLIDDVC